MSIEEIFADGLISVFVSVVLTFFIYLWAKFVAKKKLGGFSLRAIPTVITGGTLLTLLILYSPFEFKDYERGGEFMKLFLPPATLALAYPLYMFRRLIRENFVLVAIATVVSVCASVGSMLLFTAMFGYDAEILKPVLAKSVTAPVALEITRIFESPMFELCICSVFVAGMTGTFIGHYFLRLIGVKNDMAIGLAMGATSHVLGTSRCYEISAKQAAFSALVLVAVALSSAVFALFCALLLKHMQ